jgi:hypothetical protein
MLKEEVERFLLWERWGYSFRFAPEYEDCVFSWSGTPLYLTAREALFLYQRLVLGRDAAACTGGRFVLYNMREKFGGGFLQEDMPLQAHMRRSGRKSDLEREADGSYYKNILAKSREGD